MSRMKKLLLFSGTGFCVFIFLVCLVFAINSKNGSIDISYLSQTSSLIQPLVVELSHVALKRKHGFVHYAPITLSNAFRVLKKEGKATDEEVEVVEELENNMYRLANLIKKINKIKSLED